MKTVPWRIGIVCTVTVIVSYGLVHDAIEARTACMVGGAPRRIPSNIVVNLHCAAGIGICTTISTFTWVVPRSNYTRPP